MISNKLLTACFASAITITAISCGNKSENSDVKSNGIEPLVAHIDSTVKPNDDFFNYANGAWFKAHPIPESETSNGIFLQVKDTVNDAVRTICENAAKKTDAAKGSNEQKIGDFFFSGMDTVSIDIDGNEPLKVELAKIDAITNT